MGTLLGKLIDDNVNKYIDGTITTIYPQSSLKALVNMLAPSTIPTNIVDDLFFVDTRQDTSNVIIIELLTNNDIFPPYTAVGMYRKDFLYHQSNRIA